MLLAAIILALVLACVAGVQYFYLMFLEARARAHRRRIVELETENAALLERLRRAEARDDESEDESERELWPDLIEERQ
jgi:type II secretory pathway component PulJ